MAKQLCGPGNVNIRFVNAQGSFELFEMMPRVVLIKAHLHSGENDSIEGHFNPDLLRNLYRLLREVYGDEN